MREGLDCEARENRKGRKVKQGEAISFMFNRLENLHRDKGIVWGPIQPLRTNPNGPERPQRRVSPVT